MTASGAHFQVLVNDEGQYSIHPARLSPPAGWRGAGFTGTESACTEFVDEVWTDMRPQSLVDQMSRSGK
ncbi:MbtH family protein [Streptomyces graminilatus]|uniref:MbtH family protein n=1 Tax=Streptomyces graminilatus TaxID=1464070 RepID=UPI0006E26310|nr:MbtH family NRPS accessory protein [Streptomyces graminilatus]